MPPTYLVLLPFIIAFVLAVWQYYVLDPERRILNEPFGLLAVCSAVVTVYPLYVQFDPGRANVAWALLGLGLALIGLTFLVRRRIQKRKAR